MNELTTWFQNYFRFNLHGLLNVAAGFFNLFIGAFVLLKNRRSKVNQSYFYLTVVSFVWVFCFGMMSLARDINHAFPWLGYSYFFGVPYISAFVFIFSHYWLEGSKKSFLVPLGLIISTVAMVPMTFFTKKFFTISEFSWGRFSSPLSTPLAQTYYWLLLTYFFIYALLAFRNFYRGYCRSTSTHEKAQYRNFLIGIIIGYIGSIDFFVSYVFNIYAFGYLCLTTYTAIVAYTIVRHQFLDAKIVARRITVIVSIYIGLILITFPVFAFLLKMNLSNHLTNPYQSLLLLGLGLGLVLSFGPFIYAYFVRHSTWLRGTLATGLTHELKSPLGVIQGTLDMLKDQMTTNINKEKALDYLEMAQKNLSRLDVTVRNLLNVAKIQEERFEIEKSECDLVKIINYVIDINKPISDKKGVQINFSGPTNLPLKLDEEKIEQAISNIISNALKFSEGGKISINLAIKNEQVKFTVIDEGRGLNKKDLLKVFDRFYQAQPNTKGSGIGLTIAKAWVEAHDGKIWAESEGEGKGTTVSFTLPLN